MSGKRKKSITRESNSSPVCLCEFIIFQCCLKRGFVVTLYLINQKSAGLFLYPADFFCLFHESYIRYTGSLIVTDRFSIPRDRRFLL